ncbi:hypothetical protein RFI_35789 [Reticulomyxa filosa]|uniref:Uncharacterized protein n=1 Tax=Reticulomyxa filosa TaxID=46433 RepID=X6LKI4_RETFI|nr:hypothetical protein RFI_35789 [Reticulomyxa filosa]|eukprot:ETO01652.1 hypothetical protein RFI_35789 [Reticulomyxa filosa]
MIHWLHLKRCMFECFIKEECGYDVPMRKIQKLSTYRRDSTGLIESLAYLYFAMNNGSIQISKGSRNEHESENIELVFIPVKDSYRFVMNNQLESLKSQQQRSKTSQLKRMHAMLNTNAKSQIRRGKSKEGRYVKKKADNSNSGAVFSNLRHIGHVSTALSILGRFSILTFTSSKSVRTVMHFDSSTIVQPFYQGPFYWEKILKWNNKWIHSCLGLIGRQRCDANSTKKISHHMRGWIQTKGEDWFKTIYYPSKFLSTEIAKFGQGKWTKTICENMRHRGRDQSRSKKTSSQPLSQSSHPSRSTASNKLYQKIKHSVQKTTLLRKKRNSKPI